MNKIIHVITRLDMGGSAQNTLLTCTGLAHKYSTILVHGFSLESKISGYEKQALNKRIEAAKSAGVKFIALANLVRRIDPFRDIAAFFSLCRIMAKEQPDIVHTHTSKSGFLGRWAAKISSKAWIVHTPHGHVFSGFFNAGLSRLFLLIEKLTSHITDLNIALTQGEKNDYLRLKVCPAEKIFVIHSGVDIDRYCYSEIIPSADKQGRTIGTIGWLIPVKGPMILLKAMNLVWQRFPETDLIYVGKGELEKKLRDTVDLIGVSEKVKFLGWRDDVHNILPLLDVFVLPSLNEGMGRVIVEAMSAERPIVASRTGGIPDLIQHELTGLLVPPADEKALSKAICFMLENPEKAKQMGQRAKLKAQKYSVEAMLEKLERIYDQTMGDNH